MDSQSTKLHFLVQLMTVSTVGILAANFPSADAFRNPTADFWIPWVNIMTWFVIHCVLLNFMVQTLIMMQIRLDSHGGALIRISELLLSEAHRKCIKKHNKRCGCSAESGSGDSSVSKSGEESHSEGKSGEESHSEGKSDEESHSDDKSTGDDSAENTGSDRGSCSGEADAAE